MDHTSALFHWHTDDIVPIPGLWSYTRAHRPHTWLPTQGLTAHTLDFSHAVSGHTSSYVSVLIPRDDRGDLKRPRTHLSSTRLRHLSSLPRSARRV